MKNHLSVRFQIKNAPALHSQHPWGVLAKSRGSSKTKLFRVFRLTLMLHDVALYMSAIKKLLQLCNLPVRIEPNQVHVLHTIGFVWRINKYARIVSGEKKTRDMRRD